MMRNICSKGTIVFLWVSLILLWVSFKASAQSEKGKLMVRKYVQEMGRISVPAKGKVYFMDMEVTVMPRDTRNKPISKRMKSYLMYDRMIYDSDQVTIMQDREAMYMLLHETRKLLIDKSMINDSSMHKIKQMMDFQLGLIDNCSVSSCSEVKDGEKELLLVTLGPNPETQEKLKVDKLSVYFHKKTERVATVIVYFNKDQKIRSQEVRYRSMDFDFKDLDPNMSVRSYIYDNNGVVKEKYRSYEIFDKRK